MSATPMVSLSSPHLPARNSVSRVMMRVLLALLPGFALYVASFGIGVLINVLICVLACLATEAVCLHARGRSLRTYLGDNTAIVTGVLLGLALPPLTPWWIPMVGGATAILLGKQLYGGLGYNPFNPAMLGYVVLLVSFPLQMSLWPSPQPLWGSEAGIGEQLAVIFGGGWAERIDALSGATVLDAMRSGLSQGVTISELSADGNTGLAALFSSGTGWIALAWLAGGLWLLRTGDIRWQIPVGVLAGVFLMALPFWAFDADRFADPLFHMLAGASILGAFFIATDPVSAATTPRGRLYFGLAIGALTVIIRTWGNYPDAIAFSVLLANLCVPLIDLYTQPRVYGQRRSGGREP
jgi:electron transport complex protein RnfD